MSECKRWCGQTPRGPSDQYMYCDHGRLWKFVSTSSDGDVNLWEPVKFDWLRQLSKLVGRKWF